MELHDVALGRIIKLSDDTAEVIAAEGIEIDMVMVDEYHGWVAEHLATPAFLLINRINAYSYTFEAEQAIGSLAQVRALAVIVYNRVSELTAAYMIALPRELPWNVRVFHDREAALAWLDTQR
ncbi:MAG: hypothetical protein DRR03_08315 [Gammaproteobacteria bacterium]|nr:MAG: hypothetical protein DRR03_08315 [Gammaproteobacteria bacterium]